MMKVLSARQNGIVLHPLLGHVLSNSSPDQMLDQADKAVAAGDLAAAEKIAAEVVGQVPGNVRALSLLATTTCARGDQAAAQREYAQLPADARGAVKAGCNLSLQDPP
jgi:thioredoxin-like negative regulator of GroEL